MAGKPTVAPGLPLQWQLPFTDHSLATWSHVIPVESDPETAQHPEVSRAMIGVQLAPCDGQQHLNLAKQLLAILPGEYTSPSLKGDELSAAIVLFFKEPRVLVVILDKVRTLWHDGWATAWHVAVRNSGRRWRVAHPSFARYNPAVTKGIRVVHRGRRVQSTTSTFPTLMDVMTLQPPTHLELAKVRFFSLLNPRWTQKQPTRVIVDRYQAMDVLVLVACGEFGAANQHSKLWPWDTQFAKQPSLQWPWMYTKLDWVYPRGDTRQTPFKAVIRVPAPVKQTITVWLSTDRSPLVTKSDSWWHAIWRSSTSYHPALFIPVDWSPPASPVNPEPQRKRFKAVTAAPDSDKEEEEEEVKDKKPAVPTLCNVPIVKDLFGTLTA